MQKQTPTISPASERILRDESFVVHDETGVFWVASEFFFEEECHGFVALFPSENEEDGITPEKTEGPRIPDSESPIIGRCEKCKAIVRAFDHDKSKTEGVYHMGCEK